MAGNIIHEKCEKLCRLFRCGFLSGEGIASLDGAVLKVAMAVSALDGNVTEAELRAFDRLAKECRGYTEEEARRLFREGLRLAGYVELAARTFPEDELLAVFLDETSRTLPRDFFDRKGEVIRRAFVAWVTMALADGAYSSVERRAVEALQTAVSELRDAKRERLSALSAAFATAYGNESVKNATSPAFGAGFLDRVEEAVRRLDEDEPGAAADLETLVGKG